MSERGQGEEFPPGAYTPDGRLWWKLDFWPGTKRPFGDERKLAAWLQFNINIGETFTMRDLRQVLGANVPNDREHFNRRFRELRKDGWLFSSYKNASDLAPDTYRLKAKGWHPGRGSRPKRAAITATMRRRVFERDGRRCVICFIGGGEPYPDNPDLVAVLTVGHRIPNERDQSVRSLDELQTECQQCNEPVRDELPNPSDLAEVLADIKRLNRAERLDLLRWLRAKRRMRSRLDEVYDRVRTLPPEIQAKVVEALS
ncbi:HNH endonuclease [Pseudonocardia hispaniensis]|uniref:HNH endonuclease n=1 Tax=Pseudonocardia hispaniensis TaxID=904933 RepID=A0ABW1J1P8_9PSEU